MATSPLGNGEQSIAKWIGILAFVAVMAYAGYAVYKAALETKAENTQQTTLDTEPVTEATATPNPTVEAAAKGSPAPAVVTSSTDLKAADISLDSSDIDSTTSDLSTLDTDLDAF
jgi:hypothetical protein